VAGAVWRTGGWSWHRTRRASDVIVASEKGNLDDAPDATGPSRMSSRFSLLALPLLSLRFQTGVTSRIIAPDERISGQHKSTPPNCALIHSRSSETSKEHETPSVTRSYASIFGSSTHSNHLHQVHATLASVLNGGLPSCIRVPLHLAAPRSPRSLLPSGTMGYPHIRP
jgi:hypothetical protein